MLLLFLIRVAESMVLERAVLFVQFTVRVFRERLSICVSALLLLVFRVGCGI